MPAINPDHLLGLTGAHLIECEAPHRLLPEVTQAYMALKTAAKQDGVNIAIASSFRDFHRQLGIWNNKWQGKRPLLDIQSQPLDAENLSPEAKLHAILTWSALPGASRHHWGTDFDVYDPIGIANSGQALQLVSEEYQDDGPCATLAAWLSEHAEDFGFYRPYQQYHGGIAPEAWHLSYRPISNLYQQALSCDLLKMQLEITDIAGKSTILEHLDTLYHRYVLNLGTEPQNATASKIPPKGDQL